MGLFQESSNELSSISSLSCSAEFFCCCKFLLGARLWDSWLENTVLRLVLEWLVNLLSRVITVLFHSTSFSVVALSPFFLLKPAGWQKHDLNQTVLLFLWIKKIEKIMESGNNLGQKGPPGLSWAHLLFRIGQVWLDQVFQGFVWSSSELFPWIWDKCSGTLYRWSQALSLVVLSTYSVYISRNKQRMPWET